MSAFDDLDVTPQEMLRGQVGLQLGHRQIAHLHRQFQLRLPLRAGAPVDDPATTDDIDALVRMGVIEDGSPAAWFLPLWAIITEPALVVVLERTVGTDRYVWTFPIRGGAFAEQSDLPDAMVWLFGPNLELLPRVLLDAGVLRTVDNGDDGVLDPLPHAPEWTVGIDVFARGVAPDAPLAALRLRATAGAWYDERRPATALTPPMVVEIVAAALGSLPVPHTGPTGED